MRTERSTKESSGTTSQRRRTLSNITNLSLSASWVSDPREGLIAKSSGRNGGSLEFQLRDEITALKRLVSERNATIEAQAAELDQMQKVFFVRLRVQSKVNEDLIGHNSRLSKDGGQLRDQLKLLQHEYCQMTVAYRIKQSELQLKLEESQELLERLLEQPEKSSTDESMPSKTPKKPRSSSAQRRHSIANIVIEDEWNASTKLDNGRRQEDGVKRPDLSRRSSSVSRERSSGCKQTSQQSENPPTAVHTKSSSANLYGDLIGLDPMPEGSCEGDSDSPRASTSEDASSNTGDDLSSAGKSESGLTCESTNTSRSRKSASSESSGCGDRAAQFSNHSRANQRLASSGTSSAPAPHFSRRVATSSSLRTEIARPVRRAVVKVASYAEPALNTKMRRPS